MEITIEDKRIVLTNQIKDWSMGQFNFSISLRVAQKLGDSPERVSQLRAEIERCEKAIAYLEEELRAL